MISSRNCNLRRQGVTAIWALVVLAVVAAMSAAAVGQFASARRQVDLHRNQIQADLLARSGYEWAVAGLLNDPKEYADETISPIPKGEIKVSVKKDPQVKDGFQVTSEARYPVGEKAVVVRTVRQVVKRMEGPKGIQIKALTAAP